MLIVTLLLLGIGYFYFFYREPVKNKPAQSNVIIKILGILLMMPAMVILLFIIVSSFCSGSGGIHTECFWSKDLAWIGELSWPVGLFVVPLAMFTTPLGLILLYIAFLKAYPKRLKK